jgi:hypothetical protein
VHVKGEVRAELEVVWAVFAVGGGGGLGVDGAFSAEAVPGGVLKAVSFFCCFLFIFPLSLDNRHSDDLTTTSRQARGVAVMREEQRMVKDPPDP